MNDSPEVTPAQEAVTIAMLGTLLMCAVVTYILITHINITSITGYIALIIGTGVTSGYLAPNLIAYWFGRPLNAILEADTTVEASIDTNTPE